MVLITQKCGFREYLIIDFYVISFNIVLQSAISNLVHFDVALLVLKPNKYVFLHVKSVATVEQTAFAT